MLNSLNKTVDVEFNKQMVDTISDTAYVAASAPLGGKKFAAKEVSYTRLESLYVLVQCTPNLSKYDCNRCLLQVNPYISVCFVKKESISCLRNVLGNVCRQRYVFLL